MRLTKMEIVKIITAIKIQCPEALPYRNENESDILVDMWHEILKGYPKEVVWQAVRNALKNTVYQKQNWIGAICQEIEKMQEAYEKTDHELWAELQGTFREVADCVYKFRFTYIEPNGLSQGDNARLRVKEIFNGLSPELKAYCKNTGGLIELARLSESQLNFEKGRFIKVVPQLKERAKARAQLGEGLSGLLQGLAVNLLPEGK